jgi:hypothetical protein
VEQFGPEAFNRTVGFDEYETVTQNLDYITKQLSLVKLDVTKSIGLEGEMAKLAEAALPGAPVYKTI